MLRKAVALLRSPGWGGGGEVGWDGSGRLRFGGGVWGAHRLFRVSPGNKSASPSGWPDVEGTWGCVEMSWYLVGVNGVLSAACFPL